MRVEPGSRGVFSIKKKAPSPQGGYTRLGGKMSGKPKSSWGGTRPGAGRPKQSISVRQVNAMLRKGRKWAKDTGYDIDDFLLAVIGADTELLGVDSVSMKDRIACAKLWKEYTMARVTEQNINEPKPLGPVICLPPIKGEDPALAVVKCSGQVKTDTKSSNL